MVVFWFWYVSSHVDIGYIYIYPSIHCHNLHIRTVEYCCSSPVDATNFKPQEQLQEQLLNRVHGNTKISLIVLFMIVCFVPSITSSVSMMIQKIGAFAPLDINIIYIYNYHQLRQKNLRNILHLKWFPPPFFSRPGDYSDIVTSTETLSENFMFHEKRQPRHRNKG